MFQFRRAAFIGMWYRLIPALLVICLVTAPVAAPNPNAVDIASPLARSTAVTTTETQPYEAEVQYPEGIALLYSAARGGKMEPCGCRALNLGGIDREAGMVEAVRAQATANLYIDAGGFFREFPDANLRLESWHLLDALSALKIDAMNVAFPDLREGIAGLQRLAQEKNLPFISANILDAKSGQPVFPAYRKFTLTTGQGKPVRVTVVGVTAPNVNISRPLGSQLPNSVTLAPADPEQLRARWTIAPIAQPPIHRPGSARNSTVQALLEQGGAADPNASPGGANPALEFATTTSTLASTPYTIASEVEVLRELAPRLRAECDLLILACYSSFDRTRAIVQAVPDFDIAIAGDYIKIYNAEKVGNRPTLLVSADHDGKYLGQVDIKLDDAKPASFEARLWPVLQSIQPLPRYTVHLDAYKRNTQNLPVPETQRTAQKIYAGVSNCRSCHADAFAQWRTHHHSRAMKALVDKQMHFNPDCLRCHTVAFRQPGGFTDLRVTPHLSNVQCEMCHGPGQKHIEYHRAAAQLAEDATQTAAPVPAKPDPLRMEWDAQFCMQCHDPENDPHFNFDEDIQRVRHQNPAPPRERPTTASLMGMM